MSKKYEMQYNICFRELEKRMGWFETRLDY